ncbi:hypothetical protein Bca52824_002833 [Brassica carinata]|uniref:Uncharacterized protein n=1 Tax=Brassica carinata TaxID=52824 RepID=A0A8X7WIK9_BRACI|nr:hypothetical protein Bca52824_002833 [Brassica carinata]
MVLNRESQRGHMPKNSWERVKLPRNYGKALETIDSTWQVKLNLLQHKNNQRLIKMTQMQMRKLALGTREKKLTTPKKERKRESRKEEKAVNHPFLRFDQLVSLLIMPSRLSC